MANPRSSCTVAQRLGQGGGLGPVEPRRRLVEQHQARLGHQRPTDLDEAALAEAQPFDRFVGEFAQAEQLEHLVGALRARRLAGRPSSRMSLNHLRSPRRTRSAITRWSRTVESGNSSMRWNVRPMPSRARSWTRQAGDVGAVELDRAAVGAEDAEDAVEERRLAGAVRADQPDAFARLDVDVDLVEGDDAGELLADAAGAAGGRSRHRLLDLGGSAGRGS